MDKKPRKNPKKYYCEKCDFTSKNKTDFNRHLSTTKHKMVTNGNFNGNNHAKIVDFSCELCGKVYKYKSGLSRHRKGCVETNNSLVLKTTSSKNALASMESTNQEMFEKLTNTIKQQGDLIEKLIDHQKEIIPKIGNNNNNKISINVFLNEHCKDAMNLTDFINGIKISIEDLEYTNAHGYVKGLSNIFTKNLTDMKATERPIHCSDKKRLQFYVKEENKWDKDEKNTYIDKGIRSVTHKAFNELKSWEKAHPDYNKINSPENVEWLMMIQKLSGGISETDRVKNTENIKKNMSNILGIRDAIEN